MSLQGLKTFTRRWLLIISCLGLGACGFIGDEPVQNNDIYQNSELSGGCNIDPDTFTKIMDEDIESQIKCLEKNFEQFSRYVKRPSLNSIGKRELSVFVADFFPENASVIMDGLTLLFKINLVFIDDSNDQISKDGMRRLFSLLIQANKNVSILNKNFKEYNDGKIKLEELRHVFIETLSALAQAGIQSMSHGKTAQLSITQTINDVTSRFKELSITPDQLRAVKIIKKLFVGGSDEILTCDELRDFLGRMRSLSGLAFDFLYLDKYNLKDNKEYARFALDRVDTLFNNIPLNRSDVLITHNDAAFLASLSDLKKDSSIIERTIRSAKKHLLMPAKSNEGLIAQDFKLIRVYAKVYLQSYLTWEDISVGLETTSTQPRSYFEDKLDSWSKQMIKLIDPAIFPEEIGLAYFLDNLTEIWEIENRDIQLGRSIMLIKPLLIGGKASTLNPLEIDRLLPKLKDLALTVVDSTIFGREKREKREWYSFALGLLDKANALLHQGDDFEIAFLTKGLENLKVFIPEEKMAIMTGLIEGFPSIKMKLFGGHKEAVLFKEFRGLIEMLRSLVETMHLSEVTLDLYPNELASTKLVRSLPYRHHPEYNRFSSNRLSQFKSDFKHIFAKMHYFIDEENLQTYQTKIVRTRDGFTLNMLLRHAARIVLAKYGHEEDGVVMLSMEEIDSMMKQFKPLLEPMGLWTKKIETFARNMLLLSDLFQSRSNGNSAMDVDEAVEYIGMVIVAAEIQSRLMQVYPKYCDNLGTEEEPAFATDCYRPIFFKLLFKDLKLGKKLPKLKQYVDTAPIAESLKFLRGVEGFARDIDDEAIPMAKRDLVLLVGAMLNIESTFVRFDQVDENNVLDQSELDQAYYVYRNGIVAIAELTEDQEKYTKSIFLYMIEKMEKPTPMALFIFHNNPLRGNVEAKRLNIGTLLYYLVQE